MLAKIMVCGIHIKQSIGSIELSQKFVIVGIDVSVSILYANGKYSLSSKRSLKRVSCE